MAIDAVRRSIKDVVDYSCSRDLKIIDKLKTVEPEIERFLKKSSFSASPAKLATIIKKKMRPFQQNLIFLKIYYPKLCFSGFHAANSDKSH